MNVLDPKATIGDIERFSNPCKKETWQAKTPKTGHSVLTTRTADAPIGITKIDLPVRDLSWIRPDHVRPPAQYEAGSMWYNRKEVVNSPTRLQTGRKLRDFC